MRKIKVFCLDVDKNVISVKYLEDDAKVICHEIGCSLYTDETVEIGGTKFRILCDQEGLLKKFPKPSFKSAGEVIIVGNLIVAGCGGDYESRSLTMPEIVTVIQHIDFDPDLGYHILRKEK